MYRRSLTGPVLGVLLVATAAGPAPAQEDTASRTVVVPVPEDAQVEIKQDVVYKRAGGRELGMDVYLPGSRNTDARLPAVVFLHGGPLPEDLPVAAKDLGLFTSYGRLVASSGLAAVTFSHRFTSTQMLSTAAEDVNDALAYVREHAAELSVDPDRICVWAVSAGPIFVTPMLRQRPTYLRCAVLYYGVVDPATLEEVGMTGIPKSFADEYDATEAVRASGDTLPRLVVARAGKDRPPFNRALDEFIAAALEANAPLDVMNHPQGQHGFDYLDDVPRSREIVRRTLAILRTVLLTEHP